MSSNQNNEGEIRRRMVDGDVDPEKGTIKVVMTGSASDREALRRHVYTAKVKKRLEKRFKKADDPLRIVIVRDMWLTGFDVPCLTTMYVDKPMKDHNLMQAIARVNRVFKDKPGGLVVDYIGIANDLKRALQEYTESKGTGRPTIPATEMLLKAPGRDGDCAWDAAWSGLQRLSRECVEANAGGGGPYSRPGGREEAIRGLRAADDAGFCAVLHTTRLRWSSGKRLPSCKPFVLS